MASIDQVIARARMGSEVGFSERRQFKLARRRAIEKMRRFALADPYFYILEIIQAAVAGGADYVDIACADDDVTISWTGGVVRTDELAQLFDFLFASKDRVDIAHVRSLALGVNAILLFEPETIIVESGDGTPGGTARMVVRKGAEQVDVGTAEGVLEGTYVRATGLDRAKVRAETGRGGDDDGSLEFATVEARCLAAPVPLVFNGHSLFGWSKQRVPKIFGYAKSRSFDEGDLYGSIGLDPPSEPSFQLLTHGVWVQSYQYELVPGRKIGGVVCFDRLHKTADHAGFVRDDRFEELWLRLAPYADELVGGALVDAPVIQGIDGLAYSPSELREFLDAHPRIVAIDPEHDASSAIAKAARLMARSLDAEILRAPPEAHANLRILGGRDLALWTPATDDGGAELEFYTSRPGPLPEKPWLLPPVELEARRVDALVDELVELDRVPDLEGVREAFVEALGGRGSVTATLYAPAEAEAAAKGLLVEVTTTGRSLGSRLFASAHPGRVLRVEVPTARPTAMREPVLEDEPDSTPLVLLAERMAAAAVRPLREQDRRTLSGLGVGKLQPKTAAAAVALQTLARVTVTRLRGARVDRPDGGLGFSLLRPTAGFDPFELPLLQTLSGRALSLRGVARSSDQTGGLVYGRVPKIGADLRGLDRDRILDLDAGDERVLIGLLGEAGYVRVDARDELARVDGVVVRDVAVGLRDYPDDPDFPLLVEGEVARLAQMDAAGRRTLLAKLVAQLRALVRGERDLPARRDAADHTWERAEHRRQAVRHLQWVACHALAAGDVDVVEALGLLDFPLFLDLDGRAWALREVGVALCSESGLTVHYSHALGAAELGMLVAAAEAGQRATAPATQGEGPRSLAASAFVYRLLARIGRARLAFDFDLDDVEAARDPETASEAFLVEERLDADWGRGVVGVPASPVDGCRIQVRAPSGVVVGVLDAIGRSHGVVGSIELASDRWDHRVRAQVVQALDARADALLERLIAALPELAAEPRRRETGLRVLLDHVGQQLSLVYEDHGLRVGLRTSLAERILGLPLFDVGRTTPVSGHWLVDHFQRHCTRGPGREGADLDWGGCMGASTPALVVAWLDAHLQPSRVIAPASSSTVGPSPLDAGGYTPWTDGEVLPLDVLAWNLEHWLAQLRTDPQTVSGRKGRRELAPTRVWVMSHALDGGPMEGGDGRLDVYVGHPAIHRLHLDPSPTGLGWALLAVYAHLNAVSGPITNQHEAEFQRAVARALTDGALRVLHPDSRDLFR